MARKSQRKNLPPKARHILPVPSQALVPTPENYLDGIREDHGLDGLMGGGNGGPSGGGWSNPVTGLGTFGRDKVMQGSYQEAFRLSDVELSALYNGNALAKRVIDTVPEEMFRRGWVLVVPQDDEKVPGTSGPQDGATALEQPLGGESGPAAPGSPLVDPQGVAPGPVPDNATAQVPNSQLGDKVAPDGSGAGAAGDTPAATTKPTTVAPAAGKAGASDPMGEDLSKPPHDQSGSGDATPAGEDGSGKEESGDDETAGDDQGEGARLAAAAEAYGARLSLKPRALEATIFGGLYGGGLLIVGADDGQDMALPLDETKIKTIKYFAWIDRRFAFASSWYSEIGPKYGEVRTWQIVNPFGGQSNTVVHESRCVRFDGAPVDFLMRRRLLGWTLSKLQSSYDTLRQFESSMQGVSNLMADLAQAVMKINGLAQLISSDQATLQTRMAMVDMSRSTARMLYLDAENEEFSREATPMTGVSDALQMQMLCVAAAAEQPIAILFGREPSGLNATGDADFRRFYDKTAGKQKTDLEPKLRRLYTLIFAAKDGPTAGVVPAKGIEFVWHKLYEPSELEQSTIRLNMAQADDYYINNATLLPAEVAMSRFRSGDLHLDTEIDTEKRTTALASTELAPMGAAKAEAEAEQAKDLAVTSASAKGEAAVGVKGAPAGPAAKVPGGGKKPPAKKPAAK
jgi:phage-related protein (TIGR01555 family)